MDLDRRARALGALGALVLSLAACSRAACGSAGVRAPADGVQRVGTRAGSAPAAAADHGILRVAWKGLHDDDVIVWTTFDGAVWSAQDVVPVGETSARPALAVLGASLYLAWKGGGANEGIWYARYERGGWSRQEAIPGVATSASPAMATCEGRLYVAWKGMGSDPNLWWTTFDGATWAPQARLGDAASDEGPAIAAWRDHLYVAWKPAEAGAPIRLARLDGAEWTPSREVPGAITSDGPGLAARGDRLYVAWRTASPAKVAGWPTEETPGARADASIAWSAFDGRSFGAPRVLEADVTTGPPSLVATGDDVFAAWKGKGDDRRVFLASGVTSSPQARSRGSP